MPFSANSSENPLQASRKRQQANTASFPGCGFAPSARTERPQGLVRGSSAGCWLCRTSGPSGDRPGLRDEQAGPGRSEPMHRIAGSSSCSTRCPRRVPIASICGQPIPLISPVHSVRAATPSERGRKPSPRALSRHGSMPDESALHRAARPHRTLRVPGAASRWSPSVTRPESRPSHRAPLRRPHSRAVATRSSTPRRGFERGLRLRSSRRSARTRASRRGAASAPRPRRRATRRRPASHRDPKRDRTA